MSEDVTERKDAAEKLLKANRVLRALNSVNELLLHASDELQLLNDMCRVITDVAGYRLAWVGRVEHDELKTIQPMASSGYEAGYLESLRISWSDSESGQGPTGRAVRLGQAQVVVDIHNDPQFAPWRENARLRGYASSIALPLKNHRSEVFAALNIYAAEPNAFVDSEVELLQKMADDLSFGILTVRTRFERDHYLQANAKSVADLKDALVNTIRAIAITVEKRDPYTAGHQHRVAELAAVIAAELGWHPDRIEGIKLGGMIHDIGKIYVPAEVLNRPGRLSDPEFQMIKSHPQVGYDIIKDIKFPWPVAEMLLQHHERMDGTGYPQGLKGDEILMEARIIAVADVIEAITSHRPYRAGLGIDIALEEIESKRGLIYDAVVVDVCLKLFREQGYRLESAFGEH